MEKPHPHPLHPGRAPYQRDPGGSDPCLGLTMPSSACSAKLDLLARQGSDMCTRQADGKMFLITPDMQEMKLMFQSGKEPL